MFEDSAGDPWESSLFILQTEWVKHVPIFYMFKNSSRLMIEDSQGISSRIFKHDHY